MIQEFIVEYIKSNPQLSWIIGIILVIAITEIIYIYFLKIHKRYKQSITSFAIENKFLSFLMSMIGIVVIYCILIIIDAILENLYYVIISILICICVVVYFYINKFIAERLSKQIDFKKGEKLKVKYNFDGGNSLRKGEIVTFLERKRGSNIVIKVKKKRGKINENKYYRFDKLK